MASDDSVHPRACGEQTGPSRFDPRNVGSSPRVRGTARPGALGELLFRFIPARAGNRAGRRNQSHPTAVHPRACGEQVDFRAGARAAPGSSPRVRGTGEGHADPGLDHRFIPARAGNRSVGKAETALGPVHPRACGEQPGER